jgi:iron complex outermembrane receptor protein
VAVNFYSIVLGKPAKLARIQGLTFFACQPPVTQLNDRPFMTIRFRLYALAGMAQWLLLTNVASAEPSPASQGATNEQPYRLNDVLVIGETVSVPVGGGSAIELAGGMLADREITSPRELTAIIPNLTTFDADGDRIPRFSERGLRENNFGYTETAVSVYVDDVPYFDSFSRGVPLYDVESAEFLHGPQGTTFGASRPGGVLNLFTRLPGNEWYGVSRLDAGNYDAVSFSAGAGGPFVKNEAYLGIDGLYSRRDGYFNNTFLGTHPDSRDTLAGRAQVRWTPVERLDLTFTIGADRFNDGALVARPLNQSGGFYDLQQDYDGFNRQSSHTYSCRAAWTGEQMRLVDVFAYRDWRQDLTGDFDFSPARNLVGFDRPRLNQWSEEIRAESTAEDAKLKWSVGAFAAGRDVDRNNGYNFGSDATNFPGEPPPGSTDNRFSQTHDLDLALFGQVIWTPVEKLDLTAGVRGEYDQRKLDVNHTLAMPFYGTAQLERYGTDGDFSTIEPKASVAYHFSPTLEGWFTFSTGYQPGGFAESATNATQARFSAATSQHYELGISGHCLDGSFSANLSVFWIETHDYQVYRPVSQTDFQVLNADSARSLGAEAEARYRPMKNLELRVAAGYDNAEFRSFNAPNPLASQPANTNLDGKTINFVPEFTLDASATYRHRTGLFASIGGTVVGDYWFDEENTTKQSAYALLRARAGWAKNNFEVAFVGRNLLDRHYYANAMDLGPAQGFVVTPGDPATFGVEISARF